MIFRREDSIKELKAQKEQAEQRLLDSYEAITFLFEENLALQKQNLAIMEAVTQVYEMII